MASLSQMFAGRDALWIVKPDRLFRLSVRIHRGISAVTGRRARRCQASGTEHWFHQIQSLAQNLLTCFVHQKALLGGGPVPASQRVRLEDTPKFQDVLHPVGVRGYLIY